MNYTLEEFAALHSEIERQGGMLLPNHCAPYDLQYTAPPYNKAHVDKKVTCYCNNLSLFGSPYQNEEGKNAGAKVCAVCDAVGQWPRYREAVLAASDES